MDPDSMVKEGDRVLLVDDEGRRYLVTAGGKGERIRGLAWLEPARLVGLAWGARVEQAGKTLAVLPAGTPDLLATVRRKAQIIQPKDAARILLECDVRAGARIVEAGVGSAALTIALARGVAPTGKVTTYEIREDFAQWGKENLEAAGLAPWVEVKVADIREGIAERDVDAVILDMPDPWAVVPAAWEALRPGGHFASYSPLVSQVEQTVRSLEKQGFRDVRTIELIERAWTVGERGSRPSHDMLGHTAWLTFARRFAPA